MSKTFEEELIARSKEAVAPNIFIGLGGQGCDMVAQLAEVARQNNVNSKYLGFIALDTDVNELRKIKTKSSNVVTIQTSSRMTIGEYLRYDDNARENWFPINDIILDKTPSEGAGQVRAISNLVAHNAIREGEFNKIDEAIDALFPLSTDNYQQSIHITFIGTLAGGTGSGLILPLSLYVRNYLEKVRQQKSSVIRGFFILPDVMESVIHHAEEKNNLYSNAYASLREIDAFMRRPYDVKLQARYPDLKLLIPKAGGAGYDEFNERPFDYCFLFNKSNLKETNIKHKDDLLAQAVECIYDMSISPISARVNSQEDNIIREKIKSSNRQSYAGAGASKLVYPYNDVVDYIALNWVEDSISDEWLQVDKEVEKKRRSYKESGGVGKFDEMLEYSLAIEAGEDKPFNKAIISQCSVQESAIKSTSKAAQYLSDVDAYSARVLGASQAAAAANRAKCRDTVGELLQEQEIDRSDYNDRVAEIHDEATELIDNFRLCVADTVNEANSKSEFIASTLISIKPEEVINNNNAAPCLEARMAGEQDFFMHPNAARYFLIKISLGLAEKIHEYELALKTEEIELNDAMKELDTLRNTDSEMSHALIKDKYISAEGRDADIVGIVGEWVSGVSLDEDGETEVGDDPKLDSYCKHLANVTIFKRLKNYIDSIIEGYKEIFGKLGNDLVSIDEKLEVIKTKFGAQDGKAVKYVCADANSLERLEMSCKNNITLGDLPGSFTKQFYLKAKSYADKKSSGDLADEFGIYDGCTEAEKEKGLSVFFGNIFEDIILLNWRQYVIKAYDNKLNMTVAKAILQEAVFKGCISDEDKYAYLKDALNGASNLAAEFIDKPKGVQPRQLRTALFSSEVKDSIGADAYAQFLDGLGAFQGLPAVTANKYEIRFFSAIYKIAAKNLTKMRPPMKTLATNDKAKYDAAGTYFRVYHERMKNIRPLDSENTEITPHIQRDWQFINNLPELDEDYQRQYEAEIAKAFVYAIISKKIDYRRQDVSGYNYCYELIDAESSSPRLVVSNGTYCDQIFEVLDALSISPAYVERLLEMFRDELDDEANYKIDFQQSSFVKNAKAFILEEYSKTMPLNILDIPLVYKESAGADYHVEWGEAIITAIINMVDEVANRLAPKKNVETIKNDFLYEMFELFDGNLAAVEALSDIPTAKGENGLESRGHSRLKNISNDTVTLRIYDVIADILEKNDGKHAYSLEHAENIEKIIDKRRALAE